MRAYRISLLLAVAGVALLGAAWRAGHQPGAVTADPVVRAADLRPAPLDAQAAIFEPGPAALGETLFAPEAVAGGGSWGLLADGDTPVLATQRQLVPLDLADPTAPRVAAHPRALPGGWLHGLTQRAGLAVGMGRDPAVPGEALWGGPIASAPVGWSLIWRLSDGQPVPAADPRLSFDYVRRILLPEDRPTRVVLLTRGGVRVLDVSGPAREIGYVPRTSEQHATWDATLVGDVVVFAEYHDSALTLRTVDVADPGQPREGPPITFPDAPNARAVWVLRQERGQLYLANPAEVRVLDLPTMATADGSPAAPTLLGIVPVHHTVWAMLPAGDQRWTWPTPTTCDSPARRPRPPSVWPWPASGWWPRAVMAASPSSAATTGTMSHWRTGRRRVRHARGAEGRPGPWPS